jgi:nucleoside-diphosphate-sugar epimerase
MVISRILGAAMSGRKVTVYGDGSQQRDFTYIGDAITATMAAAEADAEMAAVNIGSGRSSALSDVLDLAAAVTGSNVAVQHRPEQPGDVASTAADLTRARQLLGYQPSTALAEGLQQQWAWLTSQHDGSARGLCAQPMLGGG